MTAWVENREKSPATEITKTDWNNVRQALDHLFEGSIVLSDAGSFGGGWGAVTPPQWQMSFTLTHRATVIYELVVTASIYNSLCGTPRPEAVVGVRPHLNGVPLMSGWPVAHVTTFLNNNHSQATEIPCVGFIPDLEAGNYTLDFAAALVAAINFDGGCDHALALNAVRKSLWEIST